MLIGLGSYAIIVVGEELVTIVRVAMSATSSAVWVTLEGTVVAEIGLRVVVIGTATAFALEGRAF